MTENHLNPESILESEIFIITAQKEERFIHEYLPQVIQEVTQERIVANL